MGMVLAAVATGTGDGEFVVVELDDAVVSDDQVVLAAREPGKTLVQLPETLQASFERTLGVVGEMLLKVRSMPNAPDQAEIEFGLKIGGEAGFIFARGNSEVNFSVTLSWQKPEVRGDD
jgi:Trypsin-co-occurring domain 1